jgi:hypothetical protein
MTKKTNTPDARSRNNCWHGKAMNITYNEGKGVCVCVCVCVCVGVFVCVWMWVWVCVRLYSCHCFPTCTHIFYRFMFYHHQQPPVWLHRIFSHYFMKVKIFEIYSTEHKMCVLVFCTTFVWNISCSNQNGAGYYHKCMLVLMYSTDCSGQVLIKLVIFKQIFEKYSNVRYHKIPSNWSRGFPCC